MSDLLTHLRRGTVAPFAGTADYVAVRADSVPVPLDEIEPELRAIGGYVESGRPIKSRGLRSDTLSAVCGGHTPAMYMVPRHLYQQDKDEAA